MDVSSHSIDNGDIGSTKDYDNKNDESQEMITDPSSEQILLPSYLESERNSAASDGALRNALNQNNTYTD